MVLHSIQSESYFWKVFTRDLPENKIKKISDIVDTLCELKKTIVFYLINAFPYTEAYSQDPHKYLRFSILDVWKGLVYVLA